MEDAENGIRAGKAGTNALYNLQQKTAEAK